MATERIQFGRVCKLEFTNFTTQKKFTIDQNLRISFEFNKMFDESNNSSTGEIVIHGLTEETAYKLGTRIKDMFQTEVRCDVGFSGDPDNIQTLFYATVMNNQWIPTKGSSETRIRVSANFRDFHLGNITTIHTELSRLGAILEIIPEAFGYNYEFWATDLTVESGSTPEHVSSVLESFRVSNWSFAGNMKQYLEKISDVFGIVHRVEGNTIIFRINPKYMRYYVWRVQNSESQYEVTNAEVVANSKKTPDKVAIDKLYISEKDSKVAYVLTWDTGLLELPTIDNKNVVVPYDQKLASNEVLVKRKVIKPIIDKKTGEHKKDKDGNLRYTKPPKTMTVNRRFLSCVAQLNPSIKPDAMIRILTGYSKVDGLYRVRDCRFRGDTHEGDWIVEMQLEDTLGFLEEDVGTLPSEQEEQIEVISNNDVDVGGGDSEE